MVTLHIQDEDILLKLNRFAESDTEREAVALFALRIGLEAMPVIRGQLDRQALQDVGQLMLDRIRASLDDVLQLHQQTLLNQFSLDVEGSAIQRLSHKITESYQLVSEKIVATSVSRQYQRGSTQGGNLFEEQVGSLLREIVEGAGDHLEPTGNEFGKIDRSKVGDFVITLNDTCVAAGERIVVEAKRDRSYTRKKILEECRTARDNRAAQVSIFVWDRDSAGGKQPPLQREDNDIIVLWDVDDEATDLYLKVAYWLARSVVMPKSHKVEFESQMQHMHDAFEKIQKQLEKLDTLKKSGEKIEKEGKTISSFAKDIYDTLDIQIHRVSDSVRYLTAPSTSD